MATAPAPADPTTIGPYRVVRRLGSGGMGVVYLARDPHGAAVAVKVVRRDLAGDPGYARRFAAEAAAAQRVAGFSTARVLAADVHGPAPYLVTEFVDGPSLETVLAGRALTASETEALAVGVAAALTAIHAAGVVHRDVKPANVLMSPFGPKVIDFGIARTDADPALTSVGLVLGSPGWLAPERARGVVGPAGDVWSWALLVARAGTPWRPASGLVAVPPTAADLAALPATLAAVVRAALHPDPARRPAARDVLLRLCGSAGPGPALAATRPAGGAAPGAAGVLDGHGVPAPSRPAPRGRALPPTLVAGHSVLARPDVLAGRPPTASGSPHGPRPGSPYALPHGSPYAPPPFGPSYGSPHRPPYRSPYGPPHGPPPVARRRRWWRRKRVLIPVVLVVGLALLPSGGPDGEPLPPLTARDGMLEFQVLDTTCGLATLGSGATTRQARGELCAIDVRVRNIGDEPRRVQVAKQSLVDEAGRRFEADSGAWVYLPEARPFFDEIAPGTELTATLVYDVARDAVPATLRVHDSWLSGGASIDL